MLLTAPEIGHSYHVEVEPPDGPLVCFDSALTDYDKVDEGDDVYQSMTFANGVALYTGGSACLDMTEAERWANMEPAG